MNKAQLIEQLATRFGGNKKAAGHALDSVLDTITRSVVGGEKVAISGFGVFERTERKARTARNPATGETVQVKKTAVPKFKPGAGFKGYVSGTTKLPRLVIQQPPVVAAGAATAAKKATTKKAATKKATTKKATASRTTAKRSTAKKATKKATRPATKKSTARGTTRKASTARKTATKKGTAARATAKRTTAKRTTAKRTTAKRATAKRTTARKR